MLTRHWMAESEQMQKMKQDAGPQGKLELRGEMLMGGGSWQVVVW